MQRVSEAFEMSVHYDAFKRNFNCGLVWPGQFGVVADLYVCYRRGIDEGTLRVLA